MDNFLNGFNKVAMDKQALLPLLSKAWKVAKGFGKLELGFSAGSVPYFMGKDVLKKTRQKAQSLKNLGTPQGRTYHSSY